MVKASIAAPLHMVQLQFSNMDLTRSAKDQKISERVYDLGYVLHGHLNALFGDLAPKPFHAIEKRGMVTVLGYGSADERALEQQKGLFARPIECRSLKDLATKTMPSQWQAGHRLGFEIRVCPTVRNQRKESDAYLAAVRRLGEDDERISREPIYVEWLTRQLDGAAKLESCAMERFRLIRVFRRKQRQGNSKRDHELPRFPDVTFKGTLEITDGDAFARLLARGVGRHRAFGFGMLLLRPPSRR